MISLALTFLPLLAAFFGGYVVYRWKQDLHPWLSLSGGLLLGVALLDVVPEAIELAIEYGYEVHLVGWVAVCSILFFHTIDRLFGVHVHTDADEACHNHEHAPAKMWTRSSGMILHRFADGLAIGAGFLVSPSVGALITAAMTLHGFADGMSIVAVFRDAMKRKSTTLLVLLGMAVMAPLFGAATAYFYPISPFALVIIMAWLAGFFLFLSLSELLPQAHASARLRSSGLLLTVFGVLLAGLSGFLHG